MVIKHYNWEGYSKRLELAWRRDREKSIDRLGDWMDTCFDMKEEIKKKDRLVTQLFFIGLLFGGVLVNCIFLLILLL